MNFQGAEQVYSVVEAGMTVNQGERCPLRQHQPSIHSPPFLHCDEHMKGCMTPLLSALMDGWIKPRSLLLCTSPYPSFLYVATDTYSTHIWRLCSEDGVLLLQYAGVCGAQTVVHMPTRSHPHTHALTHTYSHAHTCILILTCLAACRIHNHKFSHMPISSSFFPFLTLSSSFSLLPS